MAAKTPDSIVNLGTIGQYRVAVATFSTNDLDDNDTWDTGLGKVAFTICEQTTEGPNDMCFDGNSAGVLTYGGKANNTGYVFVFYQS